MSERPEHQLPSTRGTWILLAVVISLFAFVMAAAALGTDSDRDDTSTAATPSVTPPTAQPKATEEAKVTSAEPDEVEERAEADNDLNLDSDVISQLGRAADIYGYGLSAGTSLNHEQSKDFAYAVALTCDEWRSGTSTVEDAVLQDVMDGAPADDAEGFNRYLKQVFCPEYYAAGN